MSLSSGHKRRKASDPVRLNLALQGGGAHGAFTWGVLDRLLDETDIEIGGISGTSAGAMNAAMLVDGYQENGREGAKTRLRDFWHAISMEALRINPFSQVQMPNYFAQIPGFEWMGTLNPADMLSRVFSPYELNPTNFNPLRNVLERLLKGCRLNDGIPLFISATDVETGEPHVFREHEVTIDVLMASACLPFVYQAVEIGGKPYWDGGYMGNPSIWPLIYYTKCADVLLVQINPIERHGTPKTANEIINRVNEISFNSSLLAEMRAIDFVRKLIQQGKLDAKEYTDVRMHRVLPPAGLEEMTAESKMNTNWNFFLSLHDIGRNQMDEWLRSYKSELGRRGTLDIKHDLLKKHHAISGKKTA